MRHYSYLHLGNQVLVLRKRYHDAVVFKHDASLLGMVEVVAVVVKEASAYVLTLQRLVPTSTSSPTSSSVCHCSRQSREGQVVTVTSRYI